MNATQAEMTADTRPPLHILQSLWGMDRVRPDGVEWTLSERLALIDEAGFDGISAHVYPGAGVEDWIADAQGRGMVIEGNAFPTTVENLRPALELAARHGIHHLVIQGDLRPYNADEAVPILQGWQDLAREYGVPLLVETHRNTITNDLWVTREYLDRLPDLPLLADLSHYVCGQEMNLPISARNEALIQRILAHAQAFHGRVSSAEQIQLELSYECHRPWIDQFMGWWRQGFVAWLSRARAGDSLTFTCELGPAPYAITDRHGLDRSNRWDEARQMRHWIRQLWDELVAHPGNAQVTPPSPAMPGFQDAAA
jgi:hypothetical protein